jgi:hypothetical protein
VRELALHILDLIENSLRAQATEVAVGVEADVAAGVLRIAIEDNGTGLQVPYEAALNPFYTTKTGKRTGLGLSLFKAAAEATGGGLVLGPSALGTGARPGLRVEVTLGLRHVDRSPLGDLGATLSSVVCTNPDVDVRVHLRLGARECRLSSRGLAAELGTGPEDSLAVACALMQRTNAELKATEVLA